MTQTPPITVLVVEDFAPVLVFVQTILQADGLEVYAASDWKTAMALLPRAKVVVLDLLLPDVETIEKAIENAKSVAAVIPTVVYSNTEDAPVIKACESAGVVQYLVKDRTSPQQIKEAVRLACAQTRTRQTEAALSSMTDSQNVILSPPLKPPGVDA